MKSPENCDNIEDVREGIDTLDREILSLIGRRSRYVEVAARFKTDEPSVLQNDRKRCSGSVADRRKRKGWNQIRSRGCTDPSSTTTLSNAKCAAGRNPRSMTSLNGNRSQ
jgi:chorismate mutase